MGKVSGLVFLKVLDSSPTANTIMTITTAGKNLLHEAINIANNLSNSLSHDELEDELMLIA